MACSRAAYRCGVRPGMSLSEATAVQPQQPEPLQGAAVSAAREGFPGDRRGKDSGATGAGKIPERRDNMVYLAEHSPLADSEVLDQLATWCERFSPVVGFEHLDPFDSGPSQSSRRSDCLYLDITNLANYFGGEQRLARLVAASFSARGYLVRVAVADTLGAAWALSQFALHRATRIDPPDGRSSGDSPADSSADASPPSSSFLVVPPGTTFHALQQLPIQALRLPPDTESLLQQLGIFQIAQLARLPRSSLLSRFGDQLLTRWDQACGQMEEVLIAHHAAPQFETDWTLEHPTTRLEVILSILSELAERLTHALMQRGEGVLQCACRLTCNPFEPEAPPLPPLGLRIGLFHPTACAEHLLQLIQMQLEHLLLPGDVERIVLSALLTAPLEHRQQELFSNTIHHTSGQLARLVDRLSSRLGATNVVRVRLHSEAQPELACGYQPLTGIARRSRSLRRKPGAARRARRAATSAQKKQQAPPLPPLRRRLIRPLHLRSPPLPLDVVAVAPDGPPMQLLWHNRTYRVARCWGPERIETGWWRGRSVRRDYYRLETESGHWLWIFRHLPAGTWFLHGMFG